MKALSLLQPWASLVVLGHKRIETRSWNTKYRGPLLIHASKGGQGKRFYETLPNDLAQYPFEQCLPKKQVEGPKYYEADFDALPYGAIIGMVDLVGTVQFEEDNGFCWMAKNASNELQQWFLDDQERAFGDYTPGRYGWLLSNPILFSDPIPCKGKLGIWTVPEDLLPELTHHL